MNRLAPVPVTLSVVSVLALGAGCIVHRWDDGQGGGYDPPSSPSSSPGFQPSSGGSSSYPGSSTPTTSRPRTCYTDADCPDHFRCDERSTCVPREGEPTYGDAGAAPDASSRPVTARADGGACDAAVYGGGCTPRCRFSLQCPAGGLCNDGRCERACTSDATCGTGAVCRDGHCQTDDRPGGMCVYASQCPAAGACINGTCHPGCSADSDCPNHADVCDRGICRPDERPQPPCTATSQCPSATTCVDGLCRPACTCDADCATAWGGSAVCQRGFCAAPEEVPPLP